MAGENIQPINSTVHTMVIRTFMSQSYSFHETILLQQSNKVTHRPLPFSHISNVELKGCYWQVHAPSGNLKAVSLHNTQSLMLPLLNDLLTFEKN
jgi:hypothetical protein